MKKIYALLLAGVLITGCTTRTVVTETDPWDDSTIVTETYTEPAISEGGTIVLGVLAVLGAFASTQ